jgi:hypothetical protein
MGAAMESLRTQHERALIALRPMAAFAVIILAEAPLGAEFVTVKQIGGSDVKIKLSDLSCIFDTIVDLERPPQSFEDDRDATDLLWAYGIGEFQNGVIRGDWSALDARCRAAVQYLCDEWDFCFIDKTERPTK